VAVGREEALRRTYVAARVAPLLAAWDRFDGAAEGSLPLAQWLPAFYDNALVELQVGWARDRCGGSVQVNSTSHVPQGSPA
jgi:hypothetical protein